MKRADLIVIGAGVGGYVCAIRAAQLGLKPVLIEKNETLGGTCLNVGCIPSKSLLESSELFSMAKDRFAEHGIQADKVGLDLSTMMERKSKVVRQLTDGVRLLMKKNRVEVVHGKGILVDKGRVRVEAKDTTELTSDHIVLATGSAPIQLDSLPFDGEHIVSSTEALSFDSVPKHLIVVGAGAVGLELGSVWKRLGAKVTILEMLPQITPFADKHIAQTLARSLKKQGIDLRTNTRVNSALIKDGKVTVSVEDKKGVAELEADRVLVAVGRRPVSEDVGLENLGVATDRAGRVQIDNNYRTNIDGLYAVGDLVSGPMLAHKAEEEGAVLAENIAGKAGHVNYATIPNVVYTWPELAMVGLTEEQAKKEHKVRIGRFLFRANGRALSMGESDGMVKVVADAESDRVLGVHIVGPRASELIAEAALAMEFHASSEDLARTVHAHPTLSECLKEAALAVDKRAIHA